MNSDGAGNRAAEFEPNIVSDLDAVLPLPLGCDQEYRHEPALAVIDEPLHLAEFITSERASLIAALRSTGAGARSSDAQYGSEAAREFSDLIDAVVRRMFTLACRTSAVRPDHLLLAIAATGGYGRRELSPYSDIDITFISHRDGDVRTDRVVRELFRLVMDVFIAKCGLEVGYAYRLLSDCGSLDHQTSCGLMDVRYIAGSQRQFIQFEAAFWDNFNAADFTFAKIAEREASLAKHGALPRCVEPHLKEGPGGLRDIQTAVWLIQAREHLVSARVRSNRGIDTLCRTGIISDGEAADLNRTKELLLRTRNTLHAISGAERDQLVVTRQEELAILLGYPDDGEDASPPVERFMADMYPALAMSRRIAERAMRAAANSRMILGIGIDCAGKQVVTANGSLKCADPAWMATACELCQRYGLTLSDGVQSAAIAAIRSATGTASFDQVASAFTQIISRPGVVYPIMQTMADLGILEWIVPEFSGLMDLIPYDASHDFTVGQHSLLVIRMLEELRQPEHGEAETEERAELRRTLDELQHPEYLMLAALVHDAGKVAHGTPHAEVSAHIADTVCRRLNWSPEATGHVRFLAQHHLLMAETSRLRDLELDRTIRDFVAVVDDAERLNMLYLLTYADTRAVGEGIWTPVKGRFLRDLWQKAAALLCSDEANFSTDISVAEVRRKIRRDLTLENTESAEVEEHIAAMPPYYLLNSTQREVALHLEFVRRVRAGEIVVDFHDERLAQYTEVTICAPDDPAPGLLARIAAGLLASGLNVHSARVVTRVSSVDTLALDTLLVDFKGRQLTPGKRHEAGNTLRSLLSREKRVDEILPRKRPGMGSTSNRMYSARSLSANRTRSYSVKIVSHDFDGGITLIEINGLPDIDFFYRVCSAVSTLAFNVQTAKLSTDRDAVRCSVYVTGARMMPDGEIKRRMIAQLEMVETMRVPSA